MGKMLPDVRQLYTSLALNVHVSLEALIVNYRFPKVLFLFQ